MSMNWAWPGGAEVAVSLTFDVDGESPYLGMGTKYERYLSSLSDGRFGLTRGMPRILALLREHAVRATFFVPGVIAERHPGIVEEILRGGHEIGHHGYLHKPVHTISAQEQQDEMARGLAALAAAGASPIRGYRSPSWEITPETFGLICSNKFLYDSSFMGDDRPYLESCSSLRLLELPVSWTLDDWPLVGWSPHFPNAKLGSPDALLTNWLGEYREAKTEGRHVSFTMHPEVIGRSSRFRVLRELVQALSTADGVWMATMEEVARHVSPLLSPHEGAALR